MLSGDVFDWSIARAGGFGWRCSATFEREDHLPNFDLLAFLDLNFFHHAAD